MTPCNPIPTLASSPCESINKTHAHKATKMNTQHETVLDVTGMSCSSCVRHVSDALRSLDGVTAVEVQLRAGKVLVRHDPAKAAVTALVTALDRAGYGSRLGVAA